MNKDMNQPAAVRVPEGRCVRCWLRVDFCICPGIVPTQTRTQLVLIRHWREARKSSNTGRIAGLALPELVPCM